MVRKKMKTYRGVKGLVSKEFAKFILIGCGSTFNTIGLAQIYQIRMGVQMGFIVGYMSSLSIAYCLNGWFIFKEKISVSNYVKFIIAYIPNFLIQNVIVGVCINLFRLPSLIGYSFGALVGVPLTFILVKGFVFKKK